MYVKSTIGVIGLIIIAFFVILALFAPELGGASTRPVYDVGVGAQLSVPAWTIFPQYGGYAVTGYLVPPVGFANPSDFSAWTLTPVANGNVTRVFSSEVPPTRVGSIIYPGSMQLNATIIPVKQKTSNPNLLGGQVFFSLSQSFQWTAKAPKEFQISVLLVPQKMVNVSAIYLNYIISTSTRNLSLSSTQTYVLDTQEDFKPYQVGTWQWSNVTDAALALSGLPSFPLGGSRRQLSSTVPGHTLSLFRSWEFLRAPTLPSR